jgi:hypothetical protein
MLPRLNFRETKKYSNLKNLKVLRVLRKSYEPAITHETQRSVTLIAGLNMCQNLCVPDMSPDDIEMLERDDIEMFEYEMLESKIIERIAKEATKNAIRDTFRLGKPIMTLENGYIVKKYQDGKIEQIKKIEKTPVISGKRIYHL